VILVFGSINIDVLVPVPRLPSPGETVLGGDYALLPGGKGANQALAARRAGASVMLAGGVANAIEPGLPFFAENIATIERRLAAPRLATLPWSASGMPQWDGAVPI